MRSRWNELVALFLCACASLLFEITLTKTFEFSLWSNYAFLVIGTAMFGLGFAGILLMRWPGLLSYSPPRFLVASSLTMAVAIPLAFLVTNNVPIHLPDAPLGWTRETLNVAVVFLFVALPYVFFGLMMSYLFANRGARADLYYFVDLVGAVLGCFLLVPLIPSLEPQGLVFLSAFASLFAALLFGLDLLPKGRFVTLGALALSAVVLASGFLVIPTVAEKIPLKVHVRKRSFSKNMAQGMINAYGWSALSRVDIADFLQDRKRVWISGGINESSIFKFDGDFVKLRQGREAMLEAERQINAPIALPHLSKKDHTVCMIGTSGGGDSLEALQMGARKVTGVEMDPMIASFVTKTYKDYAGGLFTDGDYSELIVDEGRSYIRRSGRTFDVIQQVNNFTPIAFANGALNLSENYLLTVESFKDFWDALTPDGIIAIHRYGSIRLLATAIEMMRQQGMTPEEYRKHIVVTGYVQPTVGTIMVKKSPFTEEEVDKIVHYYRSTNFERFIHYVPYRDDAVNDIENNLYHKMINATDPSVYWRLAQFNFAPPTDDKPFFNHMTFFGAKDTKRESLPLLPPDVAQVEPRHQFDRRIPKGDIPAVIVLFEAFILSTVFFGLPLFTKRELRQSLRGNLRALGYFACLGVAFIFIEICLIQRLVLFLGAPVYSIATVIGTLLVAAGFGSLASGALLRPRLRSIGLLMGSIAAAIVVLHFAMPAITNLFLGGSFAVRVLVAVAITGVLGFLMGMPMPTGIRFLTEGKPGIIPWAWAINGYFTVIGSAISVLVAINFGFMAVFFLAAGIYLAAPLFLMEKTGR
jgi:spermidine synthase